MEFNFPLDFPLSSNLSAGQQPLYRSLVEANIASAQADQIFFFFYVVEFILLFNFSLLLNASDYLQVEAKSGYLRRIVKENYHSLVKSSG